MKVSVMAPLDHVVGQISFLPSHKYLDSSYYDWRYACNRSRDQKKNPINAASGTCKLIASCFKVPNC